MVLQGRPSTDRQRLESVQSLSLSPSIPAALARMDNRFPSALLPWRDRLAVLSRQLLAQGGTEDGGGAGNIAIAAAPTFSTSTSSTSSAALPTTPPSPLVVVVVLGGCVMDVVATPSLGFALSPGGSVPGKVTLTPGGVGRNVAVALAGLLLLPPFPPLPPRPPSSSSSPLPRVRIVSVVGSDPAGDALVSSLERAGVDASGVGRLLPSSPSQKQDGSGSGSGSGGSGSGDATRSTPVVVAVNDGNTGDVACSVADVSAVERGFTPEIVRRELSRLGRERENGKEFVVVVDGNLSAAAVAAASSSPSSPSSPSSSFSGGIALFEPVSVAKGVRAVLGGRLKCRVLTPNAAELLAMARAVEEKGLDFSAPTSTPSTSGSFPSDEKKSLDSFLKSALAPASRALISRGVCEFVLVTLGEKGAALIGREGAMTSLREGAAAAGIFLAPTAAETGRRRSGDGSGGAIKLAACVVPSAPVPGGKGVVSTGGAGDAFAAGFLAAAVSCRGHFGGGERGEGSEKTTATTVAFAIAAGAAAAAQVVSSPLSSPRLDAGRVWESAGELERQARWVPL